MAYTNKGKQQIFIDALKQYGRIPTKEEFDRLGLGKDYARFYRLATEYFEKNPEHLSTFVDTRTEREKALNDYWRDVNDYNVEGTTGYNVLNRLEEGHRQQAETDQWLADAIYQQQALQQGAIVKQIADQVRNERMARLRAGMSETQIANQDMQMMMANINAVNDQMNQYAIGSMQAQAKAKNAQALAYNDYLQWAAQAGQSAGAAYAAQVGDADYATRAALDSIYGVGNWGEVEYRKQYDTSTGQKGGK
jgi:hypothetical protein